MRHAPSDPLEAAAFSLAVDVRAAEVIDRLRAGGVPSVLLKGATLGQWLYPREVRHYGDVDVLVPPDCVRRAVELLTGFGYVASPYDGPASHAEGLQRDGDPVEKVDVHRSFHYVGAAPEAFWACIDRDAVPLSLPGGAVRAPSLAARALLIALHAVIHGPSPQQREDLRRAVAQLEVWPPAVALARELDAVAGLATGLRCLPEGERLADELGLPSEGPVAMRLAARGAPLAARGLLALNEAPTLSARAALLARELFPPPLQMRKHLPLARRGRRGMIAAYAVRPLLLARALPAARRAVRAVTSSNRSSARSGSPSGWRDSE